MDLQLMKELREKSAKNGRETLSRITIQSIKSLNLERICLLHQVIRVISFRRSTSMKCNRTGLRFQMVFILLSVFDVCTLCEKNKTIKTRNFNKIQ